MTNLLSRKMRSKNKDIKGYAADCVHECFATCATGCVITCANDCTYGCGGTCTGILFGRAK